MGAPTAAKKKDTTISQMTSLLKAAKAAWKGSVFVDTAVVTARNAHAPVGNGSSTRPAQAQPHLVFSHTWHPVQGDNLVCMGFCSAIHLRTLAHLIANWTVARAMLIVIRRIASVLDKYCSPGGKRKSYISSTARAQ